MTLNIKIKLHPDYSRYEVSTHIHIYIYINLQFEYYYIETLNVGVCTLVKIKVYT